jgi:hypothetical protein
MLPPVLDVKLFPRFIAGRSWVGVHLSKEFAF